MTQAEMEAAIVALCARVAALEKRNDDDVQTLLRSVPGYKP